MGRLSLEADEGCFKNRCGTAGRGRGSRFEELRNRDRHAPKPLRHSIQLPSVVHPYLCLCVGSSRSFDARSLHCWRARSHARGSHAKSSRRRRPPLAQLRKRCLRAGVCRVGRRRSLGSAGLAHVVLAVAPSRPTCQFGGPSSSADSLLSRTTSSPSSRVQRRSGCDQLRLGRHRLQVGVSFAKEILGDAEVATFGSL